MEQSTGNNIQKGLAALEERLSQMEKCGICIFSCYLNSGARIYRQFLPNLKGRDRYIDIKDISKSPVLTARKNC